MSTQERKKPTADGTGSGQMENDASDAPTHPALQGQPAPVNTERTRLQRLLAFADQLAFDENHFGQYARDRGAIIWMDDRSVTTTTVGFIVGDDLVIPASCEVDHKPLLDAASVKCTVVECSDHYEVKGVVS